MVFENLQTWEVILFFVLMFVFLAVSIVVTFIVLSKRIWNVKVTILEKSVPYGYIPTRNDTAKLVAFGDGGEEIYFLKKLKKYKIGYGKKLGLNKIAWAIGSDGYWYNCTFGDLDEKLLEIGIMPIDRDMRFANATLRKGFQNRYADKTFFEKWGVPITIGLLVIAFLAMGGVLWFIFDKQLEIASANSEAIKSSKEVMALASEVLKNINSVRSGLIPA